MARALLLPALLVLGGCGVPGWITPGWAINQAVTQCAPHSGVNYLLDRYTAVCNDGTRYRLKSTEGKDG